MQGNNFNNCFRPLPPSAHPSEAAVAAAAATSTNQWVFGSIAAHPNLRQQPIFRQYLLPLPEVIVPTTVSSGTGIPFVNDLPSRPNAASTPFETHQHLLCDPNQSGVASNNSVHDGGAIVNKTRQEAITHCAIRRDVSMAFGDGQNWAPVTAPIGIQTNEDYGIMEVWAHNMEEEFRNICHMVKDFNYVAMDTEFPGVVARPIGEFRSSADYQYQLLKCNVDLLKIIQLGLTFFNEDGKPPPNGIFSFQFNFKFSLTEDMYAEDSVGLLQRSGIQFEKHEQHGIDPAHFAEIMIVSGLVMMPKVRWLSFHASYDFGYLVGMLTNQNLPDSESEFFDILKIFFPKIYDVKYLMKSCKNLKGGLQEVANELEVARIGPQHQAGSDALLTGQTFFKMREMFFEDDIDDSKYCGCLYGLGTNYVTDTTTAPTSCTISTPTTSSSSKSIPATVAEKEVREDAAASEQRQKEAVDGAGETPQATGAIDAEAVEASTKDVTGSKPKS